MKQGFPSGLSGLTIIPPDILKDTYSGTAEPTGFSKTRKERDMPDQLDSQWDIQREELLEAAKLMLSRGLVSGTAGNVSVRLSESSEWEDPEKPAFLVTPGSVSYETMTRDDLVVVNGEIEPLGGEQIPSTESLLHHAIYRARPDVESVMHSHSLFATVAAVMGRPIPPVVDELAIYVGGSVDVADYAEPATDELAEAGVAALGQKGACLLRHHGMCAVGTSAARALEICTLVERVAQIYFYAALADGAHPLPADVIEREQAVYRMRSGFEV